MHLCTEEDYEKFYPVADASASKVESKRAKNLFYCLPDLAELGIEDLDLFGTWTRDSDYTALEVLLMPCASKWTDIYGIDHGGHEDCVWDK